MKFLSKMFRDEKKTFLRRKKAFLRRTRLNMLFSPTLLADTTLEVMLKMKILSNKNVVAEHSKMLSNYKQY